MAARLASRRLLRSVMACSDQGSGPSVAPATFSPAQPGGFESPTECLAATLRGVHAAPGRWFGSHISRQDERKGKGKGKGKKKSSGGAKGAKKPAAREETAREEGHVTEPITSTQSTTTAATATPSTTADFSYVGPWSAAVLKVKKLSLFSCFVTISSVPIMIYLDPAVLVEGAAATSMTARMSLAGSLSAFGLGTTGLLNFFVKPYVHSLKYDGSGKVLEVETLDFFARKRLTELKLDDVEGGAKDSMHPLSTFRDKRNGRVYYIDRDFFHHDELLDVLDPKEAEKDDATSWSD